MQYALCIWMQPKRGWDSSDMFKKVLQYLAPMIEVDFLQFSSSGLLSSDVAHRKGNGSPQDREREIFYPL